MLVSVRRFIIFVSKMVVVSIGMGFKESIFAAKTILPILRRPISTQDCHLLMFLTLNHNVIMFT